MLKPSSKVVSLLDVGDFIRGVSYQREEAERDPGPGLVPIIRANNLDGRSITFDDLVFVPASRVSAAQRLRKGDIVIAMSSGSADVVGKAALVRDNWSGAFGAFCGLLRPNEQFDPRFVAQFLKSTGYRHQVASVVTGTNINNLSRTTLGQIMIPKAPLGWQQSVAQRLEKLADRQGSISANIAAARRAIDRFRRSVLGAACSGRLTADWRAQHSDIEPSSSLLGLKRVAARKSVAKNRAAPHRPDRARLPDIPTSWCWAALPELGELGRGKSRQRPRNDPKLYGGNYPFIQTGDVAGSSGLITSYSQTYNEAGLAQSRLWPAGTVCITIAANIADSGLLTFPACFPDSVVGLVPDENLALPEYAELFIRTARRDLAAFAPATAQSNINLAILGKLAVALPPVEEQREIIRRVGDAYARCASAEAAIRKTSLSLDQIARSVLASAFKGEQ